MSDEASFVELLGEHVRGDTLACLSVYGELLERWSARHSLVRFGCRRELVERHILEALAVTPFLGESGRLIDVGSGAGLPGIPILVARRGWSGVLLEPRSKRWAFLQRVIRELGLAATAVRQRYEEHACDGVDLVTSRAVGDVRGVASWARARLDDGGFVALWTTDEGEHRVRSWQGWRVLSSALPCLERGRLVRLYPTPCST
jgi:16S rRNA (guanine527-N7)-methyltransferase